MEKYFEINRDQIYKIVFDIKKKIQGREMKIRTSTIQKWLNVKNSRKKLKNPFKNYQLDLSVLTH